jgi:molybdate transport system substrate-binding protein
MSAVTEIKVLTTGILKGAFDKIATRFEQDTGQRVTMSWGPSTGTSPEASPVRVRSGEVVDVLIMVSTSMDDLVATGHFVPLDRQDVAVSKIGVAVKEGQAPPDISTPAALRQTLLGARSIGFSEGASGTYVSTVLLEKLGIAREVQPKCHIVLGRKFVGAAVADGEVEIGIQQISELYLESGITVVGPLPDEVQKLSIVSAAVSAKAANINAARQFVAFLSSPFAAESMRASGLELPRAGA